MIQASHALEVSPRSLFGRHSYPKEQSLIRDFTTQVDESVMFVSPQTIIVAPVPLQHLPPDFKRRKIREHLTRARETLNELGV